MKNGYFQLFYKTGGTYIRLIPPEDGGEALSLDELRRYLKEREIACHVGDLRDALGEEFTSDKIVRLNNESMRPCKESYSLKISSDKMTATARFYAPSPGAKMLTAGDLIEGLQAKKIQHGICQENIEKFFEERSYCQDIVVAQGDPCEMGVQGRIEYMFPTDRKAKPTLRKDGSVDFHKLNTICPCKKDELLAKVIPAVYGKKGINVFGEMVRPPTVKEAKLRFGKNISASEDRLEIYAQVDGHVALINGEVSVSNILELENVGVSTGDIEYDGSIKIRGNVFSGYSVKATGDIEIKGVVEGAVVESGGNISIAQGMNGMSKGVLQAGGYVISKYLENVHVSAGTYVMAEAVLHSQVYAGTEVLVTGKKGFITGGKVMASGRIAVKTLGSPMGASTVVTVGVNPEVKKRQALLLLEMQERRKQIGNIEPVLLAVVQKKHLNISVSDEKMQHIRRLAIFREDKKRELEKIYAELDELEEILMESENPSVEVEDAIYPGTKICIQDASMVVKTILKYCRFILSEGEVKMTVFS